ncbi:MAG: oligosaccharide flippase family protein [Nanoarchaeota archaeon]
MNFLRKGESDMKNIFRRIINRDFSGNTGLAIKNSTYQFSTNLTGKFGALIFTVILARIILPETFGLYSLALSTVMFFYVFSDLGVNQALIFFSAKNLNKNKGKAKAYISYLFKIKLLLALASAIILIVLARAISENYYNQPIFLVLIAGSLYMIFTSLQSFYLALSQSNNNFRNPLIKEIFLQSSRIIAIPLIIVYLRKFGPTSSSNVLAIFVSLLVISILSLLLLYYLSLKNLKLKNIKSSKLNSRDTKEIRSYIFKIALITSSILLLGNIDKIILGPFVSPEFVGYYSAAFSLVNASAFLIVFSDVFFPIFLRAKGDELKRAFEKSVRVTFFISFALFSFILIFATPLVKTIFGANYSSSINMLRLLAPLAILFPLIELYTSYIISKGSLEKIRKIVFFILVISVVLPFLFVKLMLNYGPTSAVLGVIFGVILSKAIHLLCLMWVSRKI